MDRTEAQAGMIQLAVDALTQRIAEIGFTLALETDFTRLASFLEAQNSFLNPSFHPAHSTLGPRDFWVHLMDAQGRTIGTSAEKVLETDDLLALVATGRIWYARGFAEVGGPESVPLAPVPDVPRGLLSHSGSTWVHPSARGRGLSLLMSWLSRALSFRAAPVIANTGFVRASLERTRVPRETYGYDRVELVLDGYFPPQRAVERLYLCWIDAPGFVRRVESLPTNPIHPVVLERKPEVTAAINKD